MWTKRDIEELIGKLEDAKASVDEVRADKRRDRKADAGTDHKKELSEAVEEESVEDRLDDVTDEPEKIRDTRQPHH